MFSEDCWTRLYGSSTCFLYLFYLSLIKNFLIKTSQRLLKNQATVAGFSCMRILLSWSVNVLGSTFGLKIRYTGWPEIIWTRFLAFFPENVRDLIPKVRGCNFRDGQHLNLEFRPNQNTSDFLLKSAWLERHGYFWTSNELLTSAKWGSSYEIICYSRVKRIRNDRLDLICFDTHQFCSRGLLCGFTEAVTAVFVQQINLLTRRTRQICWNYSTEGTLFSLL